MCFKSYSFFEIFLPIFTRKQGIKSTLKSTFEFRFYENRTNMFYHDDVDYCSKIGKNIVCMYLKYLFVQKRGVFL